MSVLRSKTFDRSVHGLAQFLVITCRELFMHVVHARDAQQARVFALACLRNYRFTRAVMGTARP